MLGWILVPPLHAYAEQNGRSETAPTVAEGYSKTVWDGAYTGAQLARGQAAFQANCSRCHLDDLSGRNGPALKGNDFFDHWRQYGVDVLFNMIKTGMPPGNRGNNRLSDAAYLDIVTYILRGNGFPEGPEELTITNAPHILFTSKDGPKPVPNSALVLVVGCLAQGTDNAWMLTRASEPIRSKTEDANAGELKASEAKALGANTFWLANFDYIGSDFSPAPHKGHKVQAKGFLVRQPNRERINLTAFDSINATCD
jgi:mono/diheme cytochrome c family protein